MAYKGRLEFGIVWGGVKWGIIKEEKNDRMNEGRGEMKDNLCSRNY